VRIDNVGYDNICEPNITPSITLQSVGFAEWRGKKVSLKAPLRPYGKGKSAGFSGPFHGAGEGIEPSSRFWSFYREAA
jgi:hypothetical protein